MRPTRREASNRSATGHETGWAALAPPHAGAYVNWLMEEGEDRVRQSYGDERYDRLRALKRRYDPENVFRLNQNVRP